MVSHLGETLEFECQKKATKIREQLSKKEVGIRRKVADIQKIKVEALKKTEEMKYSAQHDLEKISKDVMKTKDLDAEVKTRLTSEITDLKNEIERKYSELRNTIVDRTASL
jgi:protein subunit release factor A